MLYIDCMFSNVMRMLFKLSYETNLIIKPSQINTFHDFDKQKSCLKLHDSFYKCAFISVPVRPLETTFTATRYLPPYMPHVGPLDPVIFKEATLFTCIRVH